MKVTVMIALLALLFGTACLPSLTQENNDIGVEPIPSSSSLTEGKEDDTVPPNAIYRYGLTKSEWQELQRIKAEYEAMTEEEQRESEQCHRMIYFPWEEILSVNLIQYVDAEGDQFEEWGRNQTAADRCTDVYSFAKHFNVGYNELNALIRDNEALSEMYPPDTFKRRFEYFNYQGLTEEQWEGLQKNKADFDALTDMGKDVALEGGQYFCSKFIHLWWEDSIPGELISYVGSERAEEWFREALPDGQCHDIYSFSAHFSISLAELKTIVDVYLPSGDYDPDTMERRWAYFNGEPEN